MNSCMSCSYCTCSGLHRSHLLVHTALFSSRLCSRARASFKCITSTSWLNSMDMVARRVSNSRHYGQVPGHVALKLDWCGVPCCVRGVSIYLHGMVIQFNSDVSRRYSYGLGCSRQGKMNVNFIFWKVGLSRFIVHE